MEAAKRCRCGLAENKYSWKAYVAMTCVQFGYAGMNLVTKVSLDRDASGFVLVVYRQAFATLLIAPLALLFERKMRPLITFPVFMHMFALGLLGPVTQQNLYYAGLKLSSPMLSCAVTNLLPAFTFAIALLCRMEKAEKKWKAKVAGVTLTVAGALLIISLLHNGRHSLFSILLILGSTLSCASFLILQAVTISKFPAPLTVTAVVCGLGTLQSTAFALVMEPNPTVWNIGFSINLFSTAYAGIVSSGIAYYVQGVVVDMAGPVFASAFNPLVTIIVGVMSAFILAQKIYLAGVMGAILMIIGACTLLWGKHNDIMTCKEEHDDRDPEAIKSHIPINNIWSLPTIFEDDDHVVEAKPDRAALTRIVIAPCACNHLEPVITVEEPIKLQASLNRDSIKNESL